MIGSNSANESDGRGKRWIRRCWIGWSMANWRRPSAGSFCNRWIISRPVGGNVRWRFSRRRVGAICLELAGRKRRRDDATRVAETAAEERLRLGSHPQPAPSFELAGGAACRGIGSGSAKWRRVFWSHFRSACGCAAA